MVHNDKDHEAVEPDVFDYNDTREFASLVKPAFVYDGEGDVVAWKEFLRDFRFYNDMVHPLCQAFVAQWGTSARPGLFIPADASIMTFVFCTMPAIYLPNIKWLANGLNLISHMTKEADGVPVNVGVDITFPVSFYSYKDFRNTILANGGSLRQVPTVQRMGQNKVNVKLLQSMNLEYHNKRALEIAEHKRQSLADTKVAELEADLRRAIVAGKERKETTHYKLNHDLHGASGNVNSSSSSLLVQTIAKAGDHLKLAAPAGDHCIIAKIGDVELVIKDNDYTVVKEYDEGESTWVKNYSNDRSVLSMLTDRVYSHDSMMKIMTRTDIVPQHFIMHNGNIMQLTSAPVGADTLYTIGVAGTIGKVVNVPFTLMGGLAKGAVSLFKSNSDSLPAILRQPETSKWTSLMALNPTFRGIASRTRFINATMSDRNIRLKGHHVCCAQMGIITTHGNSLIRARHQVVCFEFSYELLTQCLHPTSVLRNYEQLRSYATTAILQYGAEYAPHVNLLYPLTVMQGTQLMLEHLLCRSVEIETAGTQGFTPGLLLPL